MGKEARQGTGGGRPLRPWIVGALIGLALLLVPSVASAAPAADAGCTGPADGQPLTPLGGFREAQTFAAVHTGGLQRVTVTITNLGGAADFLVQILPTDANGVPTNAALAATTIPGASVSQGPTNLEASFSPAAPVTAGGTYAVAVSRPTANPVIPLWQITTRMAAACPGSGFVSNNASSGWSPQLANADIIFQTYVDPALFSGAGGGQGKGGNAAGFTLVNKRGRLFAKVPGAGKLVVDDAKRPSGHHKRRGQGQVKRTKTRAKKAGLVPLRIELTDRAIRHALKTRKLNVLAAVTYKPAGGQPSTITFRIKARL
jgi:hypothetical protein